MALLTVSKQLRPYLEPTFRTLHCHNLFLRNFENHLGYFIHTREIRLAIASLISPTPKIHIVTLQGAECGLEDPTIFCMVVPYTGLGILHNCDSPDCQQTNLPENSHHILKILQM